MPTVEVYYQMTEKDTHSVNGFWKAVHIILFAIIIVCGFSNAYSFGKVLSAFGDNCILFANVTLSTEDAVKTSTISDENSTVKIEKWNINLQETIWGTEGICSFCQFTPIMSAIFGIIWMAFFMMCSKGGAGYPGDMMLKPWHLIYPTSIFAIIFTVVLVASQFELLQGMQTFCKQLGDSRCGKPINAFTFSSYKKINDPSTNYTVSQYVGKISILAWLGQIGMLLARVFCIADFGLHIVSVTEKIEEDLDPDLEKAADVVEDDQETSFVEKVADSVDYQNDQENSFVGKTDAASLGDENDQEARFVGKTDATALDQEASFVEIADADEDEEDQETSFIAK